MRYSEVCERVEIVQKDDLGSRRGSRNRFKLYSNPNPQELNTLAKASGNKIRFSISTDGSVYMWNSREAIHDDVLHLAGVDEKFGGHIQVPGTVLIRRDQSPRDIAPLLRANPHFLTLMGGPNFRVMRKPVDDDDDWF